MHLLRLLCSIALFDITLANLAANLSAIIPHTPACSLSCTVQSLSTVNCPLDQISSCLCTNAPLQKTLALCVIATCNITEQRATGTIFQQEICKGVHQETKTKEIPTAVIILASITYPIVFMRFWSRWTIAKKVWWDDWWILVTIILLIPRIILPFIYPNEGFGRHIWDVRPERVEFLRKSFYVTQLIYCSVLITSKLSILFLYLRIFSDKKFQKIIKGFIVIIIIHGLIFLFCIAFSCVPVSAIWTQKPARCLNLQAMVFTGAGISIFDDFFMMLIPIWELRKLNLTTRKKVALAFMFALGSFASITSIVRLRFLAKFSNSVDVTWDNVDVLLWSDIEMFTAVICASLICVRPLVVKAIPDFVRNIYSRHEKEPTDHKKYVRFPSWNSNSNAKNNDISSSKNINNTFTSSKSSTGKSMAETVPVILELEKPLPIAPPPEETVVKVWIKKSTSVGSSSIHMDDLNSSSDSLTPNFLGRTVVEVSTPLSPPADTRARGSNSALSGLSSKQDPETSWLASS